MNEWLFLGIIVAYFASGIVLAPISYRMTMRQYGDKKIARQFAALTLLSPPSILFELTKFR